MAQPNLAESSRAFIAAALAVLKEERVIPTSVHQPFIHAGSHYFGASMHGLPEYKTLEGGLNDAFPDRFSNPLQRSDPEFASTYIFSVLEGVVAKCAADGNFSTDSPHVDGVITEMLEVLAGETYEVICCRAVTHFAMPSPAVAQVGEIRVIASEGGPRSFEKLIPREIPGGYAAFKGNPPFFFDPPEALLVIREITNDADPYVALGRLSAKLDRFLFLVRLLTAATVKSHYEVRGAGTLVSRVKPVLEEFIGTGRSEVRRTVDPFKLDDGAMQSLGGLIDAAEVVRKGMVLTSFDSAMVKFNASTHRGTLFAELVDLATALEATLASSEKDSAGLTLRLRNRAAALLATEKDPAAVIFKDVGVLYDLRSKLVHGGAVREKDLEKALSKISSVPETTTLPGLAGKVGHAVDRMRDLVRRAILARVCLATGADAAWPLDERNITSVDGLLADSGTREKWRMSWQERLVSIGAGEAVDPPRAAVDFLSRADRAPGQAESIAQSHDPDST